MATYVYRAYDADGRIVDGRIEAKSHPDALESLRSQGLSVQSLQPEKRKPYAWQQDTALSWEDVNLFSNQLASMARSHLPLAAGIRNMALDIRRPRMKKALQQLEADLENGHSLSHALDRQGDAFPHVIVSMLRSGESSGNLPAVLHLCSQHSSRMSELKQNFKAASVYPLFMLFIGAVILAFMMIFVIPQFGDIFREFGGELPLPTQILLNVSRLPAYIWILIPAALALVMIISTKFLRSTFRSTFFSNLQDSALYAIPGLSSIYYRATLARFFQTLATLMKARVPIVESLSLAGAASGSYKMQLIAEELASQQENGFDLSQAMAMSRHFSNHMCWLVSMGEQHNDVEGSLESLAESLERETRGLDNMIMSMLTPVMIIFIGLIFGFIVTALYMPIFTLGDSISGG